MVIHQQRQFLECHSKHQIHLHVVVVITQEVVVIHQVFHQQHLSECQIHSPVVVVISQDPEVHLILIINVDGVAEVDLLHSIYQTQITNIIDILKKYLDMKMTMIEDQDLEVKNEVVQIHQNILLYHWMMKKYQIHIQHQLDMLDQVKITLENEEPLILIINVDGEVGLVNITIHQMINHILNISND